MLPKRRIGQILVWALALLPVVLWLLLEPVEPIGRRRRFEPGLHLGQIAGLLGMAMLSISFVLASRARFLEDYFGGLDKMYQTHHRLGLIAFVLLLIHPVAYAVRFIPDRMERALLFLFPLHEKLSINLGAYALWGLILLIALTLYRKVSYDRWKLSHKFLGLVLILGTIHMLSAESAPGRTVAVLGNTALRYYMISLTALGLASFGYKLIVVPVLSRRHPYTVEAARRLNEDVLEIELTPRRRPVPFLPGQFVFVTFYEHGLTREAHPFTICTVPEEKKLVLMVKALGDFTEALYRQLSHGARARVEGPYGRFDYRKGAPGQIWLAGGVGIVPFLSWARAMLATRSESHKAILYYCVHSRSDAVYYQEFLTIAAQVDTLQVVLVCSEEQGHLHATDIGDVRGKDIFMCGPRRFTSDLRRQLLDRGVARQRIHYEDFEFR